MTTTETIPKIETYLKYAIENDLDKLAEWTLSKNGNPDNLDEYITLAIEKKVSKELMEILTSRREIKKQETEKKTYPISLKIHDGILLDMSPITKKTDKNSTLMIKLHMNSEKTYYELKEGKYSLKEINYQNKSGWTILHYLARNAKNIPFSMEIVSYLLSIDGIEVNLQNGSNFTSYTPLMLSAANTNDTSSIEMFKLILGDPNNDFKIQYRHDDDNGNILERILEHIDRSSIETIKILLEHPNVDINSLNINGDDMPSFLKMIDVDISLITDLIKSKKIKLNLKENTKYYTRYPISFSKLIELFTEHWMEGLLA